MIITEEVYFQNLQDQRDAIVDDFFEHHGVRGMRWGVRRQRRVDLLKRAAKKTGYPSGIAKTRSMLGYGPKLGPIDLIKGRGLSGGFQRKSQRMQARLKRIKRGRATTMDQIHRVGSFRLSDAIPVRAKNVHNPKVGTVKRDTAAVALLGTAMVVQYLARRGTSRLSEL